MSRVFVLCLMFSAVVATAENGNEAGRYVETEDYVAAAFAGELPAARTLWVSGKLREDAERALGHRFSSLRVRYWDNGDSSVWILDEIGKEMPITIGVTVNDAKIENVRVLEFRESRGWEVRYPFFTDQFDGATLKAKDRLDRSIDGITGATLSVGAVTRIAKVALIFDGYIRQQN
ncbi:MAG: FMN-binding protein [Woeseiaceae bacterium]